MISVKKTKYSRVTAQQPEVATDAHKSRLGSTSKDRHTVLKAEAKTKDGFVSESGITTSMPNTQVSNMPVTIDTDPMLVGLMPNNYNILYALYRDIYYNDPVGGSAVDLLSSLPFGEFSLGGLEDEKITQRFQENIERLGVRTLIPEMSVDQLVLGMHCHSLLYNKDKRVFVDVMPYSPENLKIQTLPFYSQEPIITASYPENYRSALATDSPRMERLRKLVGNEVFDKIRGGTLELDPMTTVYIPRKTFSDTDMGVSYYRRLLPLYLIEKNLFRGTLVESARRQRGIMHLSLGDGEQWIPSPQDMEFMVDMFMNADTDPLGAIVATRMGVNVEEIRQGGDFWKVTDFSDSVLPQKLRALSISEAFLSGDANYNVNDNSMTVFIDMMRAYREMMTRKFFYEKLFPLISMVNGYTVNAKGKIVVKDNLMDNLEPEEALHLLNDGSRLLIPTVSWSKQLKPEGDSAYMEMLNQMAEKGVPIPIRVLAAAGGLNLDELVKQKDDDLAIRKRLNEYRAELDALAPKGEGDGEGDDEDFTGEASSMIPMRAISGIRSATQSRFGKVPLLNREFGDSGEIYDTTPTGKKKLIINQKAANERINRKIVSAMKNANVSKRMSRHTIKPKKD